MARTPMFVLACAALAGVSAGNVGAATTDPTLTYGEQMTVRAAPGAVQLDPLRLVVSGDPFDSPVTNGIVAASLDGYSFPAGVAADDIATPSLPPVDDFQLLDPGYWVFQPGMLWASIDLAVPLAETGAPIVEVGVSFAMPGADTLPPGGDFAFDPAEGQSTSISILAFEGVEQAGTTMYVDGQWQPTQLVFPINRTRRGAGERWSIGIPPVATNVRFTFAVSADGTLDGLGAAAFTPPTPIRFLDLSQTLPNPPELLAWLEGATPDEVDAGGGESEGAGDATGGDSAGGDGDEVTAGDGATGGDAVGSDDADGAGTGEDPAGTGDAVGDDETDTATQDETDTGTNDGTDDGTGDGSTDTDEVVGGGAGDETEGEDSSSGGSTTGGTSTTTGSPGGSNLPWFLTGAGLLVLLLVWGWWFWWVRPAKPTQGDGGGSLEETVTPIVPLGDAVPAPSGPAPIWEDGRLAELEEVRATLYPEAVADGVAATMQRVMDTQLEVRDRVENYRQLYFELTSAVAGLDSLLDSREHALGRAQTADTVVGVLQLGALGARGTRFGVRWLLAGAGDDAVRATAAASDEVAAAAVAAVSDDAVAAVAVADDVADNPALVGHGDELIHEVESGWGGGFDPEFWKSLTDDDIAWIALQTRRAWKSDVDPEQLADLARRAGIDDLDAYRATKYIDGQPVDDRGLAGILLKEVEKVEGWTRLDRATREPLQNAAAKLTLTEPGKGQRVVLTSDESALLQRLINEEGLSEAAARIKLGKTRYLDGDLEPMLGSEELGRVRDLAQQLATDGKKVHGATGATRFEIAPGPGPGELIVWQPAASAGADLPVQQVDQLLDVLDQAVMAVAGQGELVPESMAVLDEIVEATPDLWHRLHGTAIHTGATTGLAFNNVSVLWLQMLHESGGDIDVLRTKLGPIHTAAATAAFGPRWWTDVNQDSILTTGFTAGLDESLNHLDRPFILLGAELPEGDVSIVAHTVLGVFTSPIETGVNTIFFHEIDDEIVVLFDERLDDIHAMADDVEAVADAYAALDAQLDDWVLDGLEADAHRVDGLADLYETLLLDAPPEWRAEHGEQIDQTIEELRAISVPALSTLERIRALDDVLPTLSSELEQRVTDPTSGDRRLASDLIESPTVIELGRGWMTFQTTLSGSAVPLAPLGPPPAAR